MKLTEAYDVDRLIETKKGIDRFIEMLIRNDDFGSMRMFTENVGKAVDDIASKRGIPFSLDHFYRRVPLAEEETQSVKEQD